MTAPLFTVVTPVYDPPVGVLEEMIASVVAQSWQDWELVLVDDRSSDEGVRAVLRAAAEDPRVVVVERAENGGIVAASNDGVTRARGEFVALVDHDDLLTPDALATMAEAIASHDDVDYLYSDEDKVGDGGALYDAFRKPQWSPERLRGQMYTSHLSVLRTALVREIGGFRHGFDGSQDHDLVLRVTERARRVVHVPQVLYHWRAVAGSAAAELGAKDYAWEAGRRAVDEHLVRVGIAARAELGPVPGTYSVVRDPIPAGVTISVVIPTRGDETIVWGARRALVTRCVQSLLARAGHEGVEVVVVHDEVTPPEVLADLRALAGERLVLVPYAKPFNFSEKCNLGVLAARGEIVVLLNDDIEVTEDGFLARLVAPLADDVSGEARVGATGAHLLYPNSTVQHAGVGIGGGDWFHYLVGVPRGEPGPFSALLVNREVSAVTGACLALRRETYLELGGLSELLPVNFNDVDLCLKVARAGYRIVWVADAVAFHVESATRDRTVEHEEIALMRRRWVSPPDDRFIRELLPNPTA